MDFDDLFEQYYTLYRAEAQVPASTDDEYTIALALSKEAVNAWRSYDNTFWGELFTNLQSAGTGTKTLSTGVTSYAAPTDMQQVGGYLRVLNAQGLTVQRYKIIEPQEAQFRVDQEPHCYFLGNPNTGFTLHVNPAPDTSLNGLSIDYVYYKKPTYFTTGADFTEMSDPFFVVHRMLANRFRASRNPYSQTAKQDAENSLRQMQAANNSGNWANPWKVADHSGSTWGS